MSAPIDAVVLAGGAADAAFTAATGETNRALVELAPGRTMLDLVVAALNGAESVGRVFVVGDIAPARIREQPAPRIVAPGKSLLDNVLVGLAAADVAEDDRVLLVSADIPFVDSVAIDEFAAAALESGGDLCYPIVPMSEYRSRFGALKRTTLKLREGEFTGGNAILVRAGVLTANPNAVRRAYAGRKSVLRIGRMLGWGLLVRIAVSQIAAPRLLNIALLETAVGRVFGRDVHARAVIGAHASLGADVDRAEEFETARRILIADPRNGGETR